MFPGPGTIAFRAAEVLGPATVALGSVTLGPVTFSPVVVLGPAAVQRGLFVQADSDRLRDPGLREPGCRRDWTVPAGGGPAGRFLRPPHPLAVRPEAEQRAQSDACQVGDVVPELAVQVRAVLDDRDARQLDE